MTAHALPTHARRIWKKFVAVRFISPTEEDATLAALERRAQEILAQKTPPRRSGASGPPWHKSHPSR